MRIAIDASYRMHGGGMIHLQRLLRSWERLGYTRQHTIVLCTREENLAQLGPIAPEIKIVTLPPKATQFRRFWFQNVKLPQILREHQTDVLYCPGGLAPLRPAVPTVVTFHNAAPFSEFITRSTVGWEHWIHFKILGLMMRSSAASSARVVFLSKYFRDKFQDDFGFPPSRADVVYHGNDMISFERDEALLNKLGIRRPFILCVSHLYPYKNLKALIDGYALERERLQAKNLSMALVGSIANQAHYEELKAHIKSLDLQDWIILTGPVSHHAIGGLLTSCAFFAFQSTCENCPMGLIEALAAGVPIACSNVSVMPEIAGDAAEYFDPCKPQQIGAALSRLANDSDRCRELKEKALARVAEFPSWDETARMTLESLERALAECR